MGLTSKNICRINCTANLTVKVQWKCLSAKNTVEGHGKKCTFGSGNIFSELVEMVLVNYRQSYDDYCRYNFCSGKHQHIQQKTKSIPNLNGYLLLALANSVKNRLFQEN